MINKTDIANFKRKNPRLDKDSYPSLQLLALYQLSYPDESLDQVRKYLIPYSSGPALT